MKTKLTIFALCLALIASLVFVGCNCNKPYTIKDGMIHYETPKRGDGQISMIGFKCDPIETVRIGIIGLGMRGKGFVKRLSLIEGTEIVALCELDPEKIKRAQKTLKEYGRKPAVEYLGEDSWKQMCERDDIDLIYIIVPCHLHADMAIYAMEHGKHVASEVMLAKTVKDCWRVVDTAERTRRHCIMLENCIYDHFELTTLNMAQQGLFGEIVHARGGYIHCLDGIWQYFHNYWTLRNRQHRIGDAYPTHGLGPVALALNINRGDRMTHLVAMQTGVWRGKELAKEYLGTEEFHNPDHASALIRTAKGKTISLEQNVYTHRPYDRCYQLTGVEGFANKYPVEGLVISEKFLGEGEASSDHEDLSHYAFVSKDVFNKYMELYKHPVQKQFQKEALKVGGHGGMDYIMDSRLIYCLRNGLPLDMNVYDGASWSCIVELTGTSIINNSMPVAIPDFTRGEWEKTKGHSFAFAE